jgi:hypothetical protein
VVRRTASRLALGALGAVALGLATLTVLMPRASELPTPTPDSIAALPSQWQRGANLTAYSPDAYASPATGIELSRLADLGVDHVALIPLWFMDSATSSEVFPDPEGSPGDAAIEAAAAAAQELGMSVAIAPHVDVRDGTFRGEIAPVDPAAWFRSYESMLDGYADLAERAGADELIVGTELTSMSADAEAWRALIARSRGRFSGTLTYAANWVDEAEAISFWDDLDQIGINAYMPLETGETDPSVAALAGAWAPYEDRITSLHERWGLPVAFTELGYQSRAGAAVAGGAAAAGPVSQRAQANAYEAAYRVFAKPELDWFRGIWWWDWTVDGTDPDGGGFTPAGKLAENVVAARNLAG